MKNTCQHCFKAINIKRNRHTIIYCSEDCIIRTHLGKSPYMCSRCFQEFPIQEFEIRKGKNVWYFSYCPDCRSKNPIRKVVIDFVGSSETFIYTDIEELEVINGVLKIVEIGKKGKEYFFPISNILKWEVLH